MGEVSEYFKYPDRSYTPKDNPTELIIEDNFEELAKDMIRLFQQRDPITDICPLCRKEIGDRYFHVQGGQICHMDCFAAGMYKNTRRTLRKLRRAK